MTQRKSMSKNSFKIGFCFCRTKQILRLNQLQMASKVSYFPRRSLWQLIVLVCSLRLSGYRNCVTGQERAPLYLNCWMWLDYHNDIDRKCVFRYILRAIAWQNRPRTTPHRRVIGEVGRWQHNYRNDFDRICIFEIFYMSNRMAEST